MKIIKTLILIFTIPFCSKAQTIQATYAVTKDIIATLETGEKKIATLESDGYLYRKDGRYIYFEKPTYLSEYPGGYITASVSSSSTHLVGIPMDTIQNLTFKDMDSLYKYDRSNGTGNSKLRINFKQKFDLDFYEWKMLNETKDISGLKCQKATFTVRDQLQWVVWFATDVPMQAGLLNIIGIPGLVVEAECVPLKTYYKLNSYVIGKEFKEDIFHPKEFEQPFTLRPDLKKANSKTAEKSNYIKRAELTNQ